MRREKTISEEKYLNKKFSIVYDLGQPTKFYYSGIVIEVDDISLKIFDKRLNKPKLLLWHNIKDINQLEEENE